MTTGRATCDPAELADLERALAANANNLGVGVIDLQTFGIRLIPYDETDRFARANLSLQVMAGHEAAAAMAGFDPARTRGFVLGKQGGDWRVVNLSHLNQADGQTNPMRMDPQTFAAVVQALTDAGCAPLTIG